VSAERELTSAIRPAASVTGRTRWTTSAK